MTEQHIRNFLENLRLGIYDPDHYQVIASYFKNEDRPYASITVIDNTTDLKIYVGASENPKSIYYSTGKKQTEEYSEQNEEKIVSEELYDSVLSYAYEKSKSDIILRDYQCIDAFKLSE